MFKILGFLFSDEVPVCNAAYISKAYEHNCYVPYFHDGIETGDVVTEDCRYCNHFNPVDWYRYLCKLFRSR